MLNISGNLRELMGECNPGIQYSSSLLQDHKAWFRKACALEGLGRLGEVVTVSRNTLRVLNLRDC